MKTTTINYTPSPKKGNPSFRATITNWPADWSAFGDRAGVLEAAALNDIQIRAFADQRPHGGEAKLNLNDWNPQGRTSSAFAAKVAKMSEADKAKARAKAEAMLAALG